MKRFTPFGAVLTAAVAVLAGCNPVENPTPKRLAWTGTCVFRQAKAKGK